MISLQIPSLTYLDKAAEKLVALLEDSRKLAFSGEMGAGKTTLIQSLCKALGVSQVVTSPTFALINEYFTESGESVFHFDLYRIEDITELYDMGYEDYFYSDDWCFIEWPEKAMSLLPEDIRMFRIHVNEDGSRSITEQES